MGREGDCPDRAQTGNRPERGDNSEALPHLSCRLQGAEGRTVCDLTAPDAKREGPESRLAATLSHELNHAALECCIAIVSQTGRHEYLQVEPMNGGSRLSAIDRSTPAMSRALPDLPMRETLLSRLLRLSLSRLVLSLPHRFPKAAPTTTLPV